MGLLKLMKVSRGSQLNRFSKVRMINSFYRTVSQTHTSLKHPEQSTALQGRDLQEVDKALKLEVLVH